MQLISHSVKDTLGIARVIAAKLKPGDIICLFGEFGSGKTVFTKGIAQELGIAKSKISSPSFVLIREYPKARIPLYHFDLYRLKRERDILNLGYEEYLYGSGISVIEWADRLKSIAPHEFLKISLYHRKDQERLLKFTAFGSRYRKLLKGAHGNIRY